MHHAWESVGISHGMMYHTGGAPQLHAGGCIITIANDTRAALPSVHLLGEKETFINNGEAISKC